MMKAGGACMSTFAKSATTVDPRARVRVKSWTCRKFLAMFNPFKTSYIHLRITGDPPFECMQKNIFPRKFGACHLKFGVAMSTGAAMAQRKRAVDIWKKKVCRRRRARVLLLSTTSTCTTAERAYWIVGKSTCLQPERNCFLIYHSVACHHCRT